MSQMRSDLPFDVVVVGAGAGGIMAAWRAGQLGARVVLLEKTARIGTKLLISGGGKCNLAHDGPLEDVIRAFPAEEARFIRPSCYRLPNDRIMRMVSERGIELYTRPDNRVFPLHATARDVVAALVEYLTEVRVRVCLESPVLDVLADKESMIGVAIGTAGTRHRAKPAAPSAGFGAKALLNEVLQRRGQFDPWVGDSVLRCDQVVLATGGCSYPASGTTGEGWRWVRPLGHRVTPIRPALAPIYLKDPRPDRAGVALRGCTIKARSAGKLVVQGSGDVLFTHQGISGPATLSISRAVATAERPTTVEVDLLPDETFESLVQRLQLWSSENARRNLSSFLDSIVPDRLVRDLLLDAGIERETRPSSLGKKPRNRLISTLKGWAIGEVGTVPLEKGEVVAGGVALDEVDPQTMRSRIVSGLYICGEMLDLAGPVGGYNLQAAFATGYVAGEEAAKAALSGSQPMYKSTSPG